MEQIADNIFVETEYEGVNVGAIYTREGVIAIDTPSYARQARAWARQLSAINHKSIQNLILTDYNGDRILNARWFDGEIITHAETARQLRSYDRRYPPHLLESLTQRHPEKGQELSNGPVAKPTISFSDDFFLFKGQYEIQLIAAPGPTRGNIWVHIPNARVLFVGDTLTTAMPPILYDGCSATWLQTLNKLQQWQSKVDVIVPGRGAIGNGADIDALCDYLQLMRARMQTIIDRERPYAETAVYISEFMELYPQHTLPTSWVRQKIDRTLKRIYHEMKLAKDDIVADIEKAFE